MYEVISIFFNANCEEMKLSLIGLARTLESQQLDLNETLFISSSCFSAQQDVFGFSSCLLHISHLSKLTFFIVLQICKVNGNPTLENVKLKIRNNMKIFLIFIDLIFCMLSTSKRYNCSLKKIISLICFLVFNTDYSINNHKII